MNLRKNIFVLTLLLITLSCSKKSDDEISRKVDPTDLGTYDASKQYTPNQGRLDEINKAILAVTANTSNNPRETFVSAKDWDAAKWDGTIINHKLPKEELVKALFPTPNTMLGLEQLYNKHKPFKNAKKPTWAEIDEWHRLVIEHLRRLVGTSDIVPIKKDENLFYRALWSNEYRYTTKWKNSYPLGCYKDGKAKGHCGDALILKENDQKPYFLPGWTTTITKTAGATGIFSSKSDIPWTLKLVRVLHYTIKNEGTVGHSGPFFRRELFGINFYPTGNGGMSVLMRGRGKLNNEAYE